ncbi:MAG: DUF4159 domain-containing protein [Chthoniobacteraceae bacterium]|nr:DUF4159 domain-containing protein [Chthoniobacteraceae bacterium]
MKTHHRSNDRAERRGAEEIAGGLEHIERLSRRGFLGAGTRAAFGLVLGSLVSHLLTSAARADRTVETGKFVFPRLAFSTVDGTRKHWNISPEGDAILRRELKRLTNVNVSMEPKVVRLGDFDDMCLNPFVFMTAGGSFELPPNEEQNLHEFLQRGGFILADDCMGTGKNDRDAFFQCYSKLIDKLYPDNPMRKIPYDHEIFHCYFDFPEGCPECQGVPHGAYGLFEPGTGRIMTWLSSGDIHCGWCNHWFTPEKNLNAIKMGINIIIYFLSH